LFAKRLECAVSRRCFLGRRKDVSDAKDAKRRDTAHSKRFAQFGCGFAALRPAPW
jgi:hypothetical protein